MRHTLLAAALLASLVGLPAADTPRTARPNILIAMADDLSHVHTSFAGYPAVKTPAIDRVAREGVYFRNAFAPTPGCSPSRASFLTGRYPWQIEQAGTHASSFPAKYVAFPDLLEQAGYFVGMTGKGWSPGDFSVDGRPRNPAGPSFGARQLQPPTSGMNRNDYAANFADFLGARPKDRPFYFWYGSTEPHRGYAKGSGLQAGKRLEDAPPPPFLPDTPEVRSDFLDYSLEVEWFDTHLGRMLRLLDDAGELDNTIVIVTADNGMPFPRAKANLYEFGFHEPLAIRWPARAPGGRVVDDLVGFVDLTATILEAAGVQHPGGPYPLSGRSLMNVLVSKQQGRVDPSRTAVYAARERHSSSRYNNWGYPQRAVRTPEYLYIRNFRPDRWPAGDPVVLKDDGTPEGPHSGYKDIDGGPTLAFLVARADDPELGKYLQLAVAKRPAEELFDIRRDPGCLTNLAADPKHAGVKQQLARQLEDYLRQTGDARVLDGGEVWETYKRYSPIRQFPPPAKPPQAPPAGVAQWWSSSEDMAARLTPQPELRFSPIRQADGGAVRVDDGTTYQTVLGLGSSFEHSTCYNLSLLPPDQRKRVLESLVHPANGIGMNLMRLCIGTSDFAPGPFYTYDDMPVGQEDLRLERFSIERDREYVLPVIQAAQRLNPQLRFFASPWTPPPWMKSNGKYGGGSLRPERYPHYAEYLVRFIEAYRAEGIDIHAITVQNEPGFGPEAYPSCRWTAAQQRDFIRDHLGPLFRARGIATRIWVFDHNFNNPGFPATILRDPAAAAYVDGSAFHLYEGKPEAMSSLQREFPSKSLYFTEGSVYGAKGATEIIEYFRNWSRSYNAWVTMIDHEGKPNVSGFHDCDPTIVVLNRNTLQPEYRADYYIYGQFMKFVEAGAVRVASSGPPGAPANVAFRNPDGHLVLVAANPESRAMSLVVESKGRTFSATLAATSVATFRWLP